MATNAVPIIVRRKKPLGHGAHHGGAWKIAYADFVTAMMAFFLLLWLLNSTTQEQRSGISDYFNAASVSRTESGAGQILGGATITLDGPLKGKGAPIGLPVPMPAQPNQDAPTDTQDRLDAGPKAALAPDPDFAGKAKQQSDAAGNEDSMKTVLAEREDRAFDKAEADLKHAIETVPGLLRLAHNIIVDRTEDGLRIQLIDQDRTSMFPKGSAVPYQQTRQLLEAVAKVIAPLPNRIAIVGHTDSTPYARGSNYTNWELSSDRAQASRRALEHYGVPADRIARVVGKAATDPLITSDPADARNRRISITLLREIPAPPAAAPTPAGP